MKRKMSTMLVGIVSMMSLVIPANAETKSELGYFKSYSYVATSQGSTSYVNSEMSYNSVGRLKIQGMISTGLFSDTYYGNEVAAGSSVRAIKAAVSGQKFIEAGTDFYIDGTRVKYLGVGCLS